MRMSTPMNDPFKKSFLGFTLIELLVVIAIVGILIGLSFIGLQGAREASRDSKRKSDIELIRSGLEIYRSDCNAYPVGQGDASSILATGGYSLAGDGSVSSCLSTNIYISQIPSDPTSPAGNYLYWSDGVKYEICAFLEQGPVGSVTCGSSSNCGTSLCNYKAANP